MSRRESESESGGSSSSNSRVFAEVGAACAAVLRNRKMGKRLLPSVEELALVVNANVDRASLEIVDMVFLPLSLLLNAAVQRHEKEQHDEQRGPGARVAGGRGDEGEGALAAASSSASLEMKGVSREKVLLSTLDCLHAFVRMLRESLQEGLLQSGGERVEVSTSRAV